MNNDVINAILVLPYVLRESLKNQQILFSRRYQMKTLTIACDVDIVNLFVSMMLLQLDYFPEEKIQVSSQDCSIEPQRLSLYIKKRRSVRHFSSNLVDKELITEIIDVARYAASGGNQQPVKWIVISGYSEVKK